MLYNNDKKVEARTQFVKSEEIFQKIEEDDREPEMLDQREILAGLLGITLVDTPPEAKHDSDSDY